MKRLSLLLCFSCYCALTFARREANTYFNSTAHALRVYGQSFYNPMTMEPLTGVIQGDERLPFSSPKISFKGLPCACLDTSCGCCAGLNISAINFDRRYCANFTLDPSQFEVDMKVMMNDNEIYRTSVSGRNPPPVCLPLPYVPVLDFCLRLYDLSIEGGNNLQTCIDFEARLTHSPLLVMHFNCVSVGPSGINWMRPGDSSSINVQYPNNSSAFISTSEMPPQEEQAAGVYDLVNFETEDEPSDGYPVNGTTLSPEDEDKIGEHRIA